MACFLFSMGGTVTVDISWKNTKIAGHYIDMAYLPHGIEYARPDYMHPFMNTAYNTLRSDMIFLSVDANMGEIFFKANCSLSNFHRHHFSIVDPKNK